MKGHIDISNVVIARGRKRWSCYKLRSFSSKFGTRNIALFKGAARNGKADFLLDGVDSSEIQVFLYIFLMPATPHA